MPRWLGIDWGGRRIGVALSDVEGTTAFGYTTLDARSGKAVAEIRRICDEEFVEGIVLGLPLRSDTGEESETAKSVRAFGEEVRRAVKLPLVYEDERFSSFAAEQDLKAAGWVPGKDPKALVDKGAARVLLQDHLDRRARGEIAP
jgi:putative Holliday junction resolvase